MLLSNFISKTRLVASSNLIKNFVLLQTRRCTVENKFACKNIVPDLIDNAPPSKLEIIYPLVKIDLGNEVKAECAASLPSKAGWNGQESCYYVIMLVDLDMPSMENPCNRSFLHWLVGNIPANKLKCGTTLAGYVGPLPPQNTCLHRLVFLVYKQRTMVIFDEKPISSRCLDARSCFDVRNFAVKYTLCDPIAGNFFLTQWDCSVDQLVADVCEKK